MCVCDYFIFIQLLLARLGHGRCWFFLSSPVTSKLSVRHPTGTSISQNTGIALPMYLMFSITFRRQQTRTSNQPITNQNLLESIPPTIYQELGSPVDNGADAQLMVYIFSVPRPGPNSQLMVLSSWLRMERQIGQTKFKCQ